jgi:hypothetical protein
MLDVRARDCLCYLYFVTNWSSCVPLRACMCMHGYLLLLRCSAILHNFFDWSVVINDQCNLYITHYHSVSGSMWKQVETMEHGLG